MSQQSENVKAWSKEAKSRKSKGFVDMCDTWDYDHYPVFFGGPEDDYKTGADVLDAKDGKNMQSSFGVYNTKGERI